MISCSDDIFSENGKHADNGESNTLGVVPAGRLAFDIQWQFARKVIALAESTGKSKQDRQQFKAAINALCMITGEQSKKLWKKYYKVEGQGR